MLCTLLLGHWSFSTPHEYVQVSSFQFVPSLPNTHICIWLKFRYTFNKISNTSGHIKCTGKSYNYKPLIQEHLIRLSIHQKSQVLILSFLTGQENTINSAWWWKRVNVFILSYPTKFKDLRVRAIATALLLCGDADRAFTVYTCLSWKALCSSNICPVFHLIYILPPSPPLSLSIPRNESLFNQPAYQDHPSFILFNQNHYHSSFKFGTWRN